jgi:hypothetical protein
VVELLGNRGELADEGNEEASSDGCKEGGVDAEEEADCEECEHSEHGNGSSDSNELDTSLRGVRHDVLLKSVWLGLFPCRWSKHRGKALHYATPKRLFCRKFGNLFLGRSSGTPAGSVMSLHTALEDLQAEELIFSKVFDPCPIERRI